MISDKVLIRVQHDGKDVFSEVISNDDFHDALDIIDGIMTERKLSNGWSVKSELHDPAMHGNRPAMALDQLASKFTESVSFFKHGERV